MVQLTDDTTTPMPHPAAGYPQLPDTGETYLTRRFTRPARVPKKMTYEFTRDAGFNHQYFRLREEMFINMGGAKHPVGRPDAFDDMSDILVARRGLHCIAGGRITVSALAHRQTLPMEKDGVNPATLFPALRLQERTYAELSRLAMLPEFEDGEVLPELLRRIIKKAIAERAEYVFNIAPKPLAGACRNAAQLFGIRWETHYDIAVPDSEEYEGAKMVLSVMDLTRYITRVPAAKARREKVMAE